MNVRPVAALAAVSFVLAAAPALAVDGYLPKAAVPDMTKVLPAPPAAGTGVAADDKAAFVNTRKLEGSPRWDLATTDANESAEAAFVNFSCSLGVTLDDGTAPTLSNLFSRLRKDESAITDGAKQTFAVRRPYLDLPGNICTDRPDPSKPPSFSYPSGHATLGWAYALVLAELAPDRATEILKRGRVFGESRVACGVHYPTDIEAGRTNASALVAALHANPEFRADMEKARAEVAAARQSVDSAHAPYAERCKIETDAAAQRPW
jgi:acid phosphatase (class A)